MMRVIAMAGRSKHLVGLPILFLLLSLYPFKAYGEVMGSPHDMYSQGFLILGQDKEEELDSAMCQECHLSEPKDERPLIWQAVPPSLDRYGGVGNLCFSCHDGVSIVDRNVDAALTVYHPEGHCYDGAAGLPENTDLTNTGLPPVVDGMVRCTTCHEPHNQTHRPFLRVPLVGLCGRCHQGRRHDGFGIKNETGAHPVSVEIFDNEGGASPLEVQPDFSVPFPKAYPNVGGMLGTGIHWDLGGHLSLGAQGKMECVTCHARHGLEDDGPLESLLSKEPVKRISNEFCEGCHRGERGDGEEEPPYPNPGGTITGRTYHPADDDIANGEGLILEMPEIEELQMYSWGETDPDADYPRILCTTCHTAHSGMENSPALVKVDDTLVEEQNIKTFCEICHWEPPVGHHGYRGGQEEDADTSGSTVTVPFHVDVLGAVYGSPEPGVIYCSHCHRAHNAGYGDVEEDYIPILIRKGIALCELCHELGVSHFMGDPTLPSTYGKEAPSLRRDPWPYSENVSYYEGTGETPMTITCLSCHAISSSLSGEDPLPGDLLAPAGEDVEWAPGYPEEYLCTGCHGDAPATVGEGATHPLLEADNSLYSQIFSAHLVSGETPVSYLPYGGINCHSCHRAHGAAVPGGVYILKVVRGDNADPKAIRPKVDYVDLCHSCHPKADY